MNELAPRLRSLISVRPMVIASWGFFFLILGLALFLVYRKVQVMRALIYNNFNQQQQILAQQAASQIDSILTDLAVELSTLKKHALEEPHRPLEEAMAAVVERNVKKGLIQVGTISAEGNLATVRHNPRLGLITAEQVKEACGTGPAEGAVLGPLRLEREDAGPPVVTSTLCARPGGPPGEGALLFSKIDVSLLVRSVTSSIRSGETGYAWVIDETGMFLYHPENEFIGANAFTARKQSKPCISYTQINNIMKDRMLMGEKGAGTYTSGRHRSIEGEVTKLIAFTPVRSDAIQQDRVWSVAVVAPMSEVEEAVHSVSIRNLFVETALIMGIFILGLIIAIDQNRMSRTLAELVKRTETDLHEKREFDRKIYNTEKLASIGTLAAGAAHEIKNPLGVILGFTDLLKERFEEGTTERGDLETIEDNANYARKVVQDLLGFARITEGLEDTVDVNESLDTVSNIVKNTLMTNKIDLALEIQGSLPRVVGDPREFQQAIFNLVNNSVAAMKESGGILKISAWADTKWVNITVSDTGVGIPDKIKPRIFDPFFTTKNGSEGTGLGLSLCRGIVTKFGGRLTFTSTSTQDKPEGPWGTTFFVTLPRTDGPLTQPDEKRVDS